jgi:hypothetical protein
MYSYSSAGITLLCLNVHYVMNHSLEKGFGHASAASTTAVGAVLLFLRNPSVEAVADATGAAASINTTALAVITGLSYTEALQVTTNC